MKTRPAAPFKHRSSTGSTRAEAHQQFLSVTGNMLFPNHRKKGIITFSGPDLFPPPIPSDGEEATDLCRQKIIRTIRKKSSVCLKPGKPSKNGWERPKA